MEWIAETEQRGAGEILLTSMDRDRTKAGFDLELLSKVNQLVNIPVVASGGAGTIEHCIDAMLTGKADAVLAASFFHCTKINILDLKKQIRTRVIPVTIPY